MNPFTPLVTSCFFWGKAGYQSIYACPPWQPPREGDNMLIDQTLVNGSTRASVPGWLGAHPPLAL